jgi:hypothetical protein
MFIEPGPQNLKAPEERKVHSLLILRSSGAKELCRRVIYKHLAALRPRGYLLLELRDRAPVLILKSPRLDEAGICPVLRWPLLTRGLLTLSTRTEDIAFTAARVN